jgi:cytochrome oxidase Cu insertion factor (SCO1/SenC/PrrC family)
VRALAVAVALSAVLVAGCGGDTAEEATPTTTSTTSATPPPRSSSRPQAPAIEGESLDGERISLADFRGRPVFVNVWSSW